MQGTLNKQIASDLGIHERTVKLHRTAITTKLGVHSAAELTRLWMEAGLSGNRLSVAGCDVRGKRYKPTTRAQQE